MSVWCNMFSSEAVYRAGTKCCEIQTVRLNTVYMKWRHGHLITQTNCQPVFDKDVKLSSSMALPPQLHVTSGHLSLLLFVPGCSVGVFGSRL